MTEASPRRSLPGRDWILLPLIAITTVILMLISAEAISRVVWPEENYDRCMKMAQGNRPPANCSGRYKAAEGPWVETQYNECGYRATGPCRAPLPVGTQRIVVSGSSTSFGYLVPFDRSWVIQAAHAITAQCGSTIDVQSLIDIPRVGAFGTLNDVAFRLPEVLALHPQLVALAISPIDLLEMPRNGFDPSQESRSGDISLPAAPPNFVNNLRSLVSGSRAVVIAQHFLYGTPETYVWTYLNYSGDRAGFLRSPMSPQWQTRLAYIDDAVAYIAAQLKPTGTPLVLGFAPQQAQAYIIADRMEIPGVDARALPHAIASIAQRHNAIFVDGAQAFDGLHDAADYFYRADGHLNSAGQTLLGRAMAKAVLSAQVSGFCQKEAGR